MKQNKLKATLILIVLSLIWGTSFILIKKGLVAFSAGQVGALRIVVSALIFLPLLLPKFKQIDYKKVGYISLFGLCEIGIPPFLFAYAQTVVSSSTAGILNSLVPLFTLLAGFMIFKLKFRYTQIIGVVVGLMGAVLLIIFKSDNALGHFNISDLSNSWGLLIVFATLLYGIAGNILKEKLPDVSSFMITALSFVIMGVPAGIYLFSTNFLSIAFSDTAHIHSFLAIVTLSTFGSAIAIMLFSKLVQLSNALFASFVTYLIPFVSLSWGFLDGEPLSILQILSLFIILAGIYIAYRDTNTN